DHAIEIAKRTGLPLRIAAKVDPADREYFRAEVEPLMHHPLVEYIGEITDAEKDDFLGDAYALVCPYDWPEPFGIVFIEALACGTPVLAYRRGSIPEIIEDGETGFICDTLEDLTAAVERVSLIDRRRCRQAFEMRFTVERMVQDYLKVYEQVIADESGSRARSQGPRTTAMPALMG
ncbi:MAG: glycosyltransferase, partial [Nitrospirota bacterium]|nr:glycosyltransferase [Nitrospirota bacterium]